MDNENKKTGGNMTGTNYRKLVGQLLALAPMCNFEMPEALCTDRELYFRSHYSWMNEAITALIT